MLCNELMGNAGQMFTCSYHAWQFNLDGSVYAIPARQGYDNTRFCMDDPDSSMKPVAQVESYRGFVFARLSPGGPDLLTFLGGARMAFDDMCDRAPEGEVDIVPTCFRVIQKSNWKIFLENQLDALHPSVTHGAVGKAATDVEEAIRRETGQEPPLKYHYLSAFTTPIFKWEGLETVGHPYGHCVLQGYMGLRPQDPDTLAYEAVMREHYGSERTEEILGVNVHHVLVYPCLSVQSSLQQLRAVRPLAPDRTLTEIWHFRLKGAFHAELIRYSIANDMVWTERHWSGARLDGSAFDMRGVFLWGVEAGRFSWGRSYMEHVEPDAFGIAGMINVMTNKGEDRIRQRDAESGA